MRMAINNWNVVCSLLLHHPPLYPLHPPLAMNSPQTPKWKHTSSPACLSPRCRLIKDEEAEETNLLEYKLEDEDEPTLVGCCTILVCGLRPEEYLTALSKLQGLGLWYWCLMTVVISLITSIARAHAQMEQCIDANYSLEELVASVVMGCGLLNVISININ
jgi:hypothetical protein